MERGLSGERYRPLQQHHQHADAVKRFQKKQDDVQVVTIGQSKVIEEEAVYYLTNCELLNNHRLKGNVVHVAIVVIAKKACSQRSSQERKGVVEKEPPLLNS
ncbi:hypothetical protein COOONC_07705 [Cooperia oncophora]